MYSVNSYLGTGEIYYWLKDLESDFTRNRNFSFTSANIDQMIDNHNRQFGGTSPNVTRVYITDGELDPFQVIGVLEPFGPLVYVDIIPSKK